MNYILRDIKLSKLTGTPMNDKATRLITFWGDLWRDMKVHININKGEIKCWKYGYDYYYFLQNGKDDFLRCDFHEVWSFFKDELKLKYDDTQELIQHMMDKTLNGDIHTPVTNYIQTLYLVDKTLNGDIHTPASIPTIKGMLVDKTINCDINTPAKI